MLTITQARADPNRPLPLTWGSNPIHRAGIMPQTFLCTMFGLLSLVMLQSSAAQQVASENQSLSVDEIRKIAEAGESDAQFRLGAMYADGRGVPKDDAKAVEW